MGEYPLVSIIIITYNDREYVGQAIESALSQTYPNCEIIVVDDGSTDGTDRFITENYDGRVQYHWQENAGQGSARSAGLKIAMGKYIQHLDSDDILLPHKVETQALYLEAHPQLAFVYGRTLCFVDGDCSHTWEHPCNAQACSGNLLRKILKNRNFVNNGQPLIRRSWVDRIGGFDPSIRDADDYDFMLRLAYAGANGQFLDEAVYLYRHHRNPSDPSQTSGRHSTVGQMRGEVYLWEKMCSIMQQDAHIDLDLAKCRLGEVYFQLGQILFGQGYRQEALKRMYQGLRFNQDRWAHKLVILAAASFLPAPKLRKVKIYLKAIFQKIKGCNAEV